ncbi:hypothetical protein KR059_001263 [Drosophila kikkawai]|nr:hypothetical protein KR059_001263 [Drosophila kikkawai]
MQPESAIDIHLEAMEVLMHHILYSRGVYPAQIFKKRRLYNTPVLVSIFPPLNKYLASVLKSARYLLARQELLCLEVIIYQKDNEPLESYQLQVVSLENPGSKDPNLMEYEQQLRSAIYKLSERVKHLPRLSHGRCLFKVHVHTFQDAFIRLSHESQYQEFPYLQIENFESQAPSQKISLLPLVDNFGLKMQAYIFG